MSNIFFDLDGTLTDISKRHHSVYARVVEQFDGNVLPAEEYWTLKRSDASWDEILVRSGLAADVKEEFLESFRDFIESDEYLDIDQRFSGAKEVLAKLADQHTLWLVSLRRSRENLLRQLQRLGINSYFEQVLSGHSDTKQGTLNKKAEVILEVTNVNPSDIVVGDTEADVAAAKQLGALSVAVTTGIRNNQHLQALHPDYVIHSLREIDELF